MGIRKCGVSPENKMIPERIFIQTLIGRVLADDIYMGPGFFSPFPHGTTSLSVTQEYLALQGGPC